MVGGRYHLARRIGAGGMGVVYRGETDSGVVAVKTLHVQHAFRPELAQRFRREARTASLLRSPHSVMVHDVGELEDGALFYVMDFIEGESLRQRLRRVGPLPVGEVVLMLRQLAVALEEAHGLGLVHRDLKPENLLIAPDGAGGFLLKVFDFGVVKILDERVGTVGGTRTGQIFGTPDFMSPEQVRGEPDLDGRSDIFSAGICAYLSLTGRLPFRADTPQAAMIRRLDHDASPLQTWAPHPLPPGLVHIIGRMLARRCDARYPTMAAVVSDIDLLMSSDPFAAGWSPLPDLAWTEAGERETLPPPTGLAPTHPSVSRTFSHYAASIESLTAAPPVEPPSTGWQLALAAAVFGLAAFVVAWSLAP